MSFAFVPGMGIVPVGGVPMGMGFGVLHVQPGVRVVHVQPGIQVMPMPMPFPGRLVASPLGRVYRSPW